jgi:hypothetical protein
VLVRRTRYRFLITANSNWLSSRRDGTIVAWHEVPGIGLPQKSRPVGYGMIRAGVRARLWRVQRWSLTGSETIMLSLWDEIHSPRRGFD